MGTILESDLLKSLKLRAVEENRPMADVISDAIEQYLARRQAEDERHTRKGVDAVKACILPAGILPAGILPAGILPADKRRTNVPQDSKSC
ncbi:hypothetical protein N8586_02405 [Verrucomicrobiales bacterium]|nr:hypothetical protein [Verrucomicrobiales bacterium]